MALLLFSHPFEFSRPSRILDQHFALDLEPEDMLTPLVPEEIRSLLRWPSYYFRPWRSDASQRDAGSTVSLDKEKFQASLDVQQFKPEEITVKVAENVVTVEGRHEEKEDEKGFVSRHFVRRYLVPRGHDMAKAESTLSSDGVLSIRVPRCEAKEEQQKSVPIVQTGQPAKAAEKKNEVEKKKDDVKEKKQ